MNALAASISTRVRVRLVVPCILLMLLSSLDRVNISFAALTMNRDLGLTPSQYGFAAGIFFVGYLLAQLPSVLLQRRIGMRLWISICAMTWGAAATGMAFVASADELIALRIVLGIAEGGLAPGIVLYLSQWTTESERARAFAWPMLAIPISTIVGAPLSGWLLSVDSPFGWASWRWMFLIEGLPTLLVGVASYFYFPNTPSDARWLSKEEQHWLTSNATLRARTADERKEPSRDTFTALRQPLVWASAGVWFLLLAGSYGVIFWLPQVIAQWTGLGPAAVSMVSAVPWVGAALGMLFNAAHSDRTGERFWHLSIPACVAGVCIAAPMMFASHYFALVALFVAGIGLGAAQGAFWAMPTQFIDARAMTVAVAAINIAGSTAGLVIPRVIGGIREATGAFELPIYLVAGLLIAAAILVALIRSTVGPRQNNDGKNANPHSEQNLA